MATRNTRKAIVPAAIAGFTTEQQATLRQGVAAALAAGKAAIAAQASKGSATDILIAGLACPALLAHRFEFQARDKKGNVTETKLASLYEYARKAAPFYIAGKEQRARISGFKAAILAYAGVNDATSPQAEKAWSIIKGHALPVAIALADNTIAASMTGNKLAVSGGNGTAVAAKLLNAAKTSTRALVATVNAKGTNGTAKGKGKTPTAAAAKPAKVDEGAAMKAALAYLRKVAAGQEAIGNARLTTLKAIAKAAGDIIAQETAAAAAKA
jgi:hypothetical protein